MEVDPNRHRQKFLLTHPLTGRTSPFDSWSVLCEYALDIAQVEIEKRYELEVQNAIVTLADDIIESAEPYYE